MLECSQETDVEEPDIKVLREWLPKISGECRAYIKGATKALLYAQEDTHTEMSVTVLGECKKWTGI